MKYALQNCSPADSRKEVLKPFLQRLSVLFSQVVSPIKGYGFMAQPVTYQWGGRF